MAAMPVNHQSRTHLLDLPPELLISIFKAQASMLDAVHFAATCRSLHSLYESEDSIATPVLQREIICYEEALKLAKAQLPNLKPRQLDPLTKQIYINAKEANRIVELARPYHLCKPWGIYRPAQYWKFPANIPPCPIHGVIYNGGDSDLRSLLPHERARIIHSWYTVKLYHESLSASFDEEQRQVVHEQLQRVGDVQAELLDSLMLFVCENMDDNAMEELGIEEPNPPDELVGVQAHIQTPDWERTRWDMKKICLARNPALEEKLNGVVDLCPLPGGAACKPRDRGKGLWEL